MHEKSKQAHGTSQTPLRKMSDSIEGLTMSQIIEKARDQMAETRSMLQNAILKHGWKDRVENVNGLLTCGLVTLAYTKTDVVKAEILSDDHKHGKHIPFHSRGFGSDTCPGCFVCGGSNPESVMLSNIAAFVNTREDGERVVEWFNDRARLDFRPNEPAWIQVKVGACKEHLPNLEHIHNATRVHDVIRHHMILEAIEYRKEATVDR